MIDALVAGQLYGKPVERMTRANRPFATAKVRAGTADGSLFVGVVAFRDSVVEALLALDAGDSVALSGELKITTYTDRQGEAQPSVELVAQAICTPYHVSRKRAAQRRDTDSTGPSAASQAEPEHAGAASHDEGGADDDIPF